MTPAAARVVRIAMVAGEASGDLLGGHLIEALRARLPNAYFCGIGGPKMIGQGFDAWFPQEPLAVRGYVEVLKRYREISGIRRELKRRLLTGAPDVFVGIDAPDFNLALERALKRRGVPAIHYVSPSIWAWRGKRIRMIGKSVSRVLTLFPFEAALYERENIPVTYVGHPLADILPVEDVRGKARELLGIPRQQPVFALLPGSRQSELEYMADTFIETAKLVREHLPDVGFLVPLATRETRLLFEAALYRRQARELPVRLLFGHAHEAMAASDAVLAASGTATLEAALLKRPMVIAYKMAPLTYRLMRRMGYLPYVGLPNILAGRFVVPEFIQDAAVPENLAPALLGFLNDKEASARIGETFRESHLLLKQNTAVKAAEAVLASLPFNGKDSAVAADA
ncbi:MAG: lipid-A-disaccharide synthase [Candidatus Accumulibacter sp.]|jgi:lipid-A-disaccharide synthase|nr:lipid-A-disaccharide synthase [Accumulibacter sp.]